MPDNDYLSSLNTILTIGFLCQDYDFYLELINFGLHLYFPNNSAVRLLLSAKLSKESQSQIVSPRAFLGEGSVSQGVGDWERSFAGSLRWEVWEVFDSERADFYGETTVVVVVVPTPSIDYSISESIAYA